MSHYIFNIYSLIYCISIFIALFVIALVIKRWQLMAVRYIVFFEIAAAVWSFTSVFEVSATTVHLKILWSQISYLGIITAPGLFLLFAFSFSKQTKLLNKKLYITLIIIPVITLILTATNSRHGLMWPKVTINPATNIATYSHGTWFWINVVYSYITLTAGIWTLLISILNIPGHYKGQIIALIIGSFLPFLGNIMYVFNINPTPGLDVTPIALMFTGLILSYAVLKFRMFDLAPYARNLLLENMSDGLLVIDINNRVLDINQAMKKIINSPDKEFIGIDLEEALNGVPELLKLVNNKSSHSQELCRGNSCYDVGMTPILQEANNYGKLIILRDITERKSVEQEREQLVIELQGVLQEVKELSGLLPICASCKKIRDDGGYWHEVESYVMTHTKAQFSHGICPECRNKLYPEFPREKGASKDAPMNQ